MEGQPQQRQGPIAPTTCLWLLPQYKDRARSGSVRPLLAKSPGATLRGKGAGLALSDRACTPPSEASGAVGSAAPHWSEGARAQCENSRRTGPVLPRVHTDQDVKLNCAALGVLAGAASPGGGMVWYSLSIELGPPIPGPTTGESVSRTLDSRCLLLSVSWIKWDLQSGLCGQEDMPSRTSCTQPYPAAAGRACSLAASGALRRTLVLIAAQGTSLIIASALL